MSLCSCSTTRCWEHLNNFPVPQVLPLTFASRRICGAESDWAHSDPWQDQCGLDKRLDIKNVQERLITRFKVVKVCLRFSKSERPSPFDASLKNRAAQLLSTTSFNVGSNVKDWFRLRLLPLRERLGGKRAMERSSDPGEKANTHLSSLRSSYIAPQVKFAECCQRRRRSGSVARDCVGTQPRDVIFANFACWLPDPKDLRLDGHALGWKMKRTSVMPHFSSNACVANSVLIMQYPHG